MKLLRDPLKSSYSRLLEKNSQGEAALRASYPMGPLLALQVLLRWLDRNCSLMCQFRYITKTDELMICFRLHPPGGLIY